VTLEEAALLGFRRVRRVHWPAGDYMALDILMHDDGFPLCGPWAMVYAARQLQVADLDRPQRVLVVSDTSRDWIPYAGAPVADEQPMTDERERHPFDDR
jgi:hypothetical protein